MVEDDISCVVLFKAVLSTYEGQSAIYVPPILNKQTLLAETGLDIVCGPLGELCACYHNGFQLELIQLEIADRDFVSCWLEEEDSVEISEVRHVACAGRNLPESGSPVARSH